MIVISVDYDGIASRKENVENINKLFYLRYTYIVIYTARPEYMRAATELELTMNKIKYHSLVMEKMKADYYIDDRHTTFEQLLNKELDSYGRKKSTTKD